MKLTTAQHLALNSVRNGRCFRRFTSAGNTVHSKDGCAASVLRKLESRKLIRKGDSLTPTTTLFVLTDDGRMALRSAEETAA